MKRRIFYLCPDDDLPVGGNKKIYQHVDLLNRNGFSAYVIHSRTDFRYTWFHNTTSIVYPVWPVKMKMSIFLQDLKHAYRFTWDKPRYPANLPLVYQGKTLPPINDSDVLVLSECVAPKLIHAIGKQPFVVFNQNAYATFKEVKVPSTPFCADLRLPEMTVYRAPNMLGMIVISKNNQDYLKYAFPDLRFYPMQTTIDAQQFKFSKEKLKQIAYMPRKCPNDIQQVISILIQRGKLKGWTFVPIDHKHEKDVKKILESSAIFLSFSFQEGFSLPPLEALFSGCLAVGYHGESAKEYFHPPHAIPIESNDIVNYAKAVENLALQYDVDPAPLLAQAQQTRAFLQAKYTCEQEERDLINIWDDVTKTTIKRQGL